MSCRNCSPCAVCGDENANAEYTEAESKELFCIDYAKLEKCDPIEVMAMLDKKDGPFLRMFEVYRAGMKRIQ